MTKLVPIIDTGHGGVIGGLYQTSGKRSPSWECGILYEGMFNRWIANKFIRLLDYAKIPYYHISPEFTDTTLETRVRRANKIFEKDPNSYVLSIHGNAGGGTGFEGFTSLGDTPSDPMLEVFLVEIEENFPDKRMRFDYYDGDRDKERDYYILKRTSGRAGLLELGFMDNREDYKMMWSEDFQNKMARCLFNSAQKLYNGG